MSADIVGDLRDAQAALARCRDLLRAAEWRDASSITTRDFYGRPFKSSIPQDDLRAALNEEPA